MALEATVDFTTAQAYSRIVRASNGVQVISTMGEGHNLASSRGNRDVTLIVEFRPDDYTWGDLFDDPETQATWKV